MDLFKNSFRLKKGKNSEVFRPRKVNFLGYTEDVMKTSKKRSRYFVGIAVVLLVIAWLLGGPPVNLTDPEWYYVIFPELLGFLAGTVILAFFFGWIARLIAKSIGRQGNKFDYFATTFLILVVITLVTRLFG